MTKPENMATVSASGAHGIFKAIAEEMVASSRRNAVPLKVHGVVGKINQLKTMELFIRSICLMSYGRRDGIHMDVKQELLNRLWTLRKTAL